MELLHVYRESTSVYSFCQAPKAIICVQNLPVQLCFRVSEQLRELEYLSNPHMSFPHTHHGQTPLVHARNTHTVTTATTTKLIYNLYRMSALSVSPGWLHGVCLPLGHCPQRGLSPQAKHRLPSRAASIFHSLPSLPRDSPPPPGDPSSFQPLLPHPFSSPQKVQPICPGQNSMFSLTLTSRSPAFHNLCQQLGAACCLLTLTFTAHLRVTPSSFPYINFLFIFFHLCFHPPSQKLPYIPTVGAQVLAGL